MPRPAIAQEAVLAALQGATAENPMYAQDLMARVGCTYSMLKVLIHHMRKKGYRIRTGPNPGRKPRGWWIEDEEPKGTE